MSANFWGLVWRSLMRDLRAGELHLLALALFLAVTTSTGVGFLVDRALRGLEMESHQLLAGDLLLSSDHPWPAAWRTQAEQLGLQWAESASFPSMVSHDGRSLLVEVKAVSEGYPLRGRLQIARPDTGLPVEPGQTLASGQVWLDERATRALALMPGDSLRLGELQLVMRATLLAEPERGFTGFALAPRLMLPLASLSATGLLQAGSRVQYRLYFAGAPEDLARMQAWATSRLGRGEKMESADSARPEWRGFMEKAERFLRLASALTVVLAAVAMGLASHRYVRRHWDAYAVMRCLGASSGQLLQLVAGEFILFGLLVSLAGCVGGALFQFGLSRLLAALVGFALPALGVTPWIQGLVMGAGLMLGFVLPPLLSLVRVSPLRVLRKEVNTAAMARLGNWVPGIAVLSLLLLWMAQDLRLGAWVLGGFCTLFLVFGVLAQLLLMGAVRWTKGRWTFWRWGMANLQRRRTSTLLQILAIAIGLSALLVLTAARGELLASWRASLPTDAPNRFLINLQPEQRAAVGNSFAQAGMVGPHFEPMIRGRLLEVNGRPVAPADYADDQAKRLVDREFNLSWAAQLPVGNEVVAGEWFASATGSGFSVEQGLAKTLGLKLGDVLRFDVAGMPVVAPINSLRKLSWDSMRVNFFVMGPQALLGDFPASYIAAYYLPPSQRDFETQLIRQFPNLTIVDVAAAISQFQALMDQVSALIQWVFNLALVSGALVLYAAVQGGADERAREVALFRTLGASTAQIVGSLLAEFLTVGLLAGLLAGMGAALLAWGLANFLFHFEMAFPLKLLIPAVLAGAFLAPVAGWLGLRSCLKLSPMGVLREAE